MSRFSQEVSLPRQLVLLFLILVGPSLLLVAGCSSEESETVYQRQTPVVGNPDPPDAPPPDYPPPAEDEPAEEAQEGSSGYRPPVTDREPAEEEPPPPSAVVDKPDEQEIARNYFAARSGLIRRIYDDRRSDNPDLAGRITIEVTVTNGRVAAGVVGNTTGDPVLASRILSTIRGWSVAGVEGPVELLLPYDFQQ